MGSRERRKEHSGFQRGSARRLLYGQAQRVCDGSLIYDEAGEDQISGRPTQAVTAQRGGTGPMATFYPSEKDPPGAWGMG